MANSTDNGKDKEDIGDPIAEGQIPLHVSSSQRGLLVNETPRRKFYNTFLAIPSRLSLLKSGFTATNLESPSAKFWRISEDKDEISRGVPCASSHGLHGRLNDVFSRKIDWPSLRNMSKDWIRNPMNMALLVWIVCVAVSGAILFFVMTGMLNQAIPEKRQRDVWFEVNNQILNALFTLMCLYQHPKRFYHLSLLIRWRPEDISKLRKIYSKNGTYKPHEWGHMMVVVLLLHLNCIAQYALCGLNLGYRRSNRPAIGVGICISIAIAAPAISGLYTIMSPLGRDYSSGSDEESQLHSNISGDSARPISQLGPGSLEKKFSFVSRDDQRIVENNPQWKEGVLDFWDDISLAYLSLFCTFCVFGWNMERLGFGNMYVHIATFLLFCMAPFWIFNLAAVNIDSDTVRSALGVTGVVLCGFGLLYGGFWRIQMRKRYNLPAYHFCCGNPGVTDCALWLCCCWCSLAQEVRTGYAYDIVEDKFCRKETNIFPHKTIVAEQNSGPSSPFTGRHLPLMEAEPCRRSHDETMSPPTPSVMQRESR